MGAGFYQELEAYRRLTGAEIGPWEVSMLRALYGVQLAASQPQDQNKGASTGTGVAALLRGMKAKQKGKANG